MKYLLFGMLGLMFMQCPSKKMERNYEKKLFVSSEGQELPYRILYPDNYSKKKKYPLILFLHGSGERGSDNEAQLVHIAPKFLSDDFQSKHPSIVVFPQCSADDTWTQVERTDSKWTVSSSDTITAPMQAVVEWMDDFLENEAVDRQRIYLSGLSMGGFGTYDLLSRKPEWFAAAIPICGGGNRRNIGLYEDVPIWIFHGKKDPVVPVSLSQEMADEFKLRKMNYRYTEYPEGTHDVWSQAWNEPDIINWLFSQQKQLQN